MIKHRPLADGQALVSNTVCIILLIILAKRIDGSNNVYTYQRGVEYSTPLCTYVPRPQHVKKEGLHSYSSSITIGTAICLTKMDQHQRVVHK